MRRAPAGAVRIAIEGAVPMTQRVNEKQAAAVASREQLGREDWLALAEDIIAEQGFSAVRVLPMAKRLGVSRSSFYWHFRDREDLVHSFVDGWRQRQLEALRSYLSEGGGGVEEQIRRSLRKMIGNADVTIRDISIGMAVRDLARHDAYVARVVDEVDAARFAFNENALRLMSRDSAGVEDMAMLLYAATTGARVLSVYGGGSKEARADWLERLIGDLMIQWYRRGGGELLT